jgi:hypothetical protein
MARGEGVYKFVIRAFAYGGIALLVFAAVLLFRTLRVDSLGSRADGVVIRNDWDGGDEATAHATVRFEAEGRTVEFTSQVGTSPPLHAVGDRVTVYFWPGRPEEAVLGGFAEQYLRSLVPGVLGLIFLAIGGSLLWGPGWLARRRARIVAGGLPVRAKVTAIRRDESLEVNGQSPWVIVAVFKDEETGRLVECKSHYLWADPTPDHPPGSEVTVYYLAGRPEKHAFDLGKPENEG